MCLICYDDLFDMTFIWYVSCLLCSIYVMLVDCYAVFFVTSIICYTDYFVMIIFCYAVCLLCLLMYFLVCAFLVMLRNTLICTSKFICYPASWRVFWYAGSIYGMIVSHAVSILYSSVQFVLYERNLQMHKLSKHKLMGNFDGVLLQIYTENTHQIEHTHI